MGTSNNENLTSYSVTQEVKSVVKHPKYVSQGGSYFDAGILTLTKPVLVSEFVRFICLPVQPVDAEDYLKGALVTMTGWGIEQLTRTMLSSHTTKLKFINLEVGAVI